MTREDINTTVQENLFEVYPVGDGSLDEIVGVVYLKDLFGKLDNEKFSIDDIIRPVQYFHEYTDVYKVLEQTCYIWTGLRRVRCMSGYRDIQGHTGRPGRLHR